MATLNTVAKDFVDQIRAGQNWLAVWKEEKDWHAEVFHPCTNGIYLANITFSAAETRRIREIGIIDPQLCFIRGEPGNSENLTVAEMEKAICAIRRR